MAVSSVKMNFNQEGESYKMPIIRAIFLAITFIVVAVFANITPTSIACAGPATPNNTPLESCDPKFMEQLNNKALLEAQREIELNGRYIWKPDSVLALTCFQQAMNHATVHLPEIFSEAGESGGGKSPRREDLVRNPITGVTPSDQYPDHFANSMANVIGPVLKKYLGANYAHPFSSLNEIPNGVSVLGVGNKLRGFDTGFDSAGAQHNANVDYSFVWGFPTPTSFVEYQDPLRRTPTTAISDDCNWMQELWNLSKCYSFDLEADFAGVAFRKLDGTAQFAAQDLRGKTCGINRPSVAHGGLTLAGTQRATEAAVDVDKKVDNVTNIATAETNTSNPKLFDDIVSNFNSILDLGTAGGCLGGAIPTGVEVFPTAGNSPKFKESFCPNPGCSFTAGGSCQPN